MLDMALADPPNYYDLVMPTSYLEAKTRMGEMGGLMVKVIDMQPPQQTSAQLLTAQTIKDIGQGWSAIFAIATNTPEAVGVNEAQFQWQPGGVMSVALPDEYGDQVCAEIVRPLTRAAVWRNLMNELSGTEQINEIEARFSEEIESAFERGDGGVLDGQLDAAVSDIFEVLFRRQENRGPIFNEFRLDWGGGADQCFSTLYREVQ
jgi:hypothetical protein